MEKNITVVIFLFFVLPFVIQAETPLTPLERNQFTKVTSHDELIKYIKDLNSLSTRIVIDTIGRSVQGRPIPLVHVTPNRSENNIKVLLFCQQHGNEPSGKEAALALLQRIASDDKNMLYQHLDLYVIPSSNPDGNESEKRANANKEDLNRDHLLLSQPETQFIHAIFARIQPEVTLDVHEFSAYRKEFIAAGFIRDVDEQFGAPTNLNIPYAIREYALNNLFPFLKNELAKQNVSFANYLKMDEPNDTVRPSTTSIGDGRQSFAILNTFSFILEGKNGRNFHDEIKRRTENQGVAIDAFLRFVDEHSNKIQAMVLSERKKTIASIESVFVMMDYRYSGEKISLPMKNLSTGSDTLVSMKYSPEVQSILSVKRPKAYLIPQQQSEMIEILNRHNIEMKKISKPIEMNAEIYTITDVQSVWMENKPFYDISTHSKTGTVTAKAGDYMISLSQQASTMLVITLEPSSMWGLMQNESLSGLRILNSQYPIYRITK